MCCVTCGGKGWLYGKGFVCACRAKSEERARLALREAERRASPRRFTGQAITGFGSL